jgi:glycine/D-amino acid oxidase-like deaminating enzyme
VVGIQEGRGCPAPAARLSGPACVCPSPLRPPARPPARPRGPAQVGRLARKSFALHAELAAALGADAIGYRRLSTLSVAAAAQPGGGGSGRGRLGAPLPEWLDGAGISQSSSIGTPETTAQVHPQLLTRALWAAAEAAGATLVAGAVAGLEFGEGGAVAGAGLL